MCSKALNAFGNIAFIIIIMQNSMLPFGLLEMGWIVGFLCAIIQETVE